METEAKASTQKMGLSLEPGDGSNYLYLDIETLPHWDQSLFRCSDKRLKDPEKVKENIEKNWAKSALEPELGCVVTIGYAIDDNEPSCIWYPAQKGTGNPIKDAHYTELSILEDFSNRLEMATKIVTWAGKRFDLPFLIKRYIKHRWYGTSKLLVDFMKHSHIDMKDTWQFKNFREDIKLHDAARMLDLKIDSDIGGEDVFYAYRNGNISAIDFHCKQDVRLLRDVHRAAKLGGLC